MSTALGAILAVEINLLLDTERLRDGGSLAVTFQGGDSCSYMLKMPIKNFSQEPECFSEPVLINRTTGLLLEVGRENAKIYLNQLKSYAVNEQQILFINHMLRTVGKEME